MSQPNPRDHISVAQNVCRRWQRMFPYAADDILSVAYVALIEACNDFDGRGTIEGYIKLRVDRSVQCYITEDKIIRIPQATVSRKIKKNLALPTYKEVILDSLPLKENREREGITLQKLEPYLTEIEKGILKLRLKGKKLKEIGKAYSITHVGVIKHLKKIQEKYSRLWRRDNS